MNFKGFSPKQKLTMTWWMPGGKYARCEGIICDGAVRSGKTVCTSLSFVCWAFYRFSGADFALCGKTLTSLRRNVIRPLSDTLACLGFVVRPSNSHNYVDVEHAGRHNRFYLFGGMDESSAAFSMWM